MAEIWGAVAVGVGVLGSAVIGSNAAGKAASAQEAAANTAAGTQLQMYNQTREDQTPYREAGYTALSRLGAGTAPGGEFDKTYTGADLTSDPGYQFRLAQGQRGVDASASARGGVLSGAAIKGSEEFNQNFASNEYQNAYNRFNSDQSSRYNRLASIAGLGQTSTAQTGAVGTYAANQIGSAQIGAGNAAAAGYVGQANAINSGATTLGNYFLQRQYAPQNTSSYSGAGVADWGDGE